MADPTQETVKAPQASVGSPTINTERMLVDHLPRQIAELEAEVTQRVGELLVAEARLARLKLLLRIING